MFEWLDHTVYSNVTWFDLIVAVLIYFAALLASKILTLQLRRRFKDKINK
jgi:hypothetical protein